MFLDDVHCSFLLEVIHGEDCSPTPTLTCVEVPFDYPPRGAVEGKIP